MQLVMTHLGPLRDYGDLRTIQRPRNVGDVLQRWAPPAAGTICADHVQTGFLVFNDRVHLCQGILLTRIGQHCKTRSVGRDGHRANASGQREDLRRTSLG